MFALVLLCQYRLNHLLYTSCGGLEFQAKHFNCGGIVALSANTVADDNASAILVPSYMGYNVTLESYSGTPFLWTHAAVEQSPVALVLQTAFLAYFGSLFGIAIILAWGTPKHVRQLAGIKLTQVDEDEDTVTEDFIKTSQAAGSSWQHSNAAAMADEPWFVQVMTQPQMSDDRLSLPSVDHSVGANLNPQSMVSEVAAAAMSDSHLIPSLNKPRVGLHDWMFIHDIHVRRQYCAIRKVVDEQLASKRSWGIDWLDRIGSNAQLRMKTRSSSLLSWKALATITSLGVAMWLPVYCWIYYSLYIHWQEQVLLVAVIPFCWLLLALAARVMQYPYLMYYENYLVMLVLYHKCLDFHVPAELRAWRNLRHFYTVYRMPFVYGLAQWAFVVFLLMCVLSIFSIVILILQSGFIQLTFFGGQLPLLLGSISLMFTYAMMKRAIQVWTMQQAHIRLLQDHRFLLKVQAANDATSAMTSTSMVDDYSTQRQKSHQVDISKDCSNGLSSHNATELISMINDLMEYIASHDLAPEGTS